MQVTKFKAPQYTMAARVEPPGDKTLKPGPGAHSPEKVRKSIAQGGPGGRGGKAWRCEPAGVAVAMHLRDAVCVAGTQTFPQLAGSASW